MEYFAPVHQFEIRFSKLLNFSSIAEEVLSPFIPFSNDIQIDRTGGNANYNLIYDNYNIGLQYDRILIRFEGDIEPLQESGSVVQDPFFAIYKKLSEHTSFGAAKNLLLYTIYVKTNDSDDIDSKFSSIVSDFTKKYVKTEETKAIIENLDDISLTFELKGENELIRLEFGPYKGIGDLNKRNFLIASQEMANKCLPMGQMCIATITGSLAKSKGLNFSSYKSLYNISKSYIHNLWK